VLISPEWRPLILREARAFPQLFGGYAVEWPGGTLVVNERVPTSRFNFVQDVRLAPGRVLAFVEKALEHYYQRALRPTFELPDDLSQPGTVRALLQAGYVPQGPERSRKLLLREGGGSPPADPRYRVRPAGEEDLGTFLGFLTEPRHQMELYRYLEEDIFHPQPGERTIPYLAWRGEDPVAVALFHEEGPVRGIHGVATGPRYRGQGAASGLVAGILRAEEHPPSRRWVLAYDGPGTPRALGALGFGPALSFETYALPPGTRPPEGGPGGVGGPGGIRGAPPGGPDR
jgi:GNAT superfamily N-acetyltransferase